MADLVQSVKVAAAEQLDLRVQIDQAFAAIEKGVQLAAERLHFLAHLGGPLQRLVGKEVVATELEVSGGNDLLNWCRQLVLHCCPDEQPAAGLANRLSAFE